MPKLAAWSKPRRPERQAAQTPALIERTGVEKRRVANGAEVIGIERRGRSETLGADRNTRPLEERAVADAAIIGEKQRKNPVGDPANEMEGGRSR